MPPEIRILCCVKCKTFQGDIVKKAKEWYCKMCGQKQSVFQEFFRGSGVECHEKVKELHLSIHKKQEMRENELLSLLGNDDLNIDLIEQEERKRFTNQATPSGSIWTKFLDEPEQRQFNSVEVQQVKNLKRKLNSNSHGNDEPTGKKPLGSTSANSKWDL